MDKLPQVLQKEIWEYVRGDRESWKTLYNVVMLELRLDSSVADMGPHWSQLSDDLALVWGQSSSDPSWSYSILMYLSRGWELVAHFPHVRSREICGRRIQELKRRLTILIKRD